MLKRQNADRRSFIGGSDARTIMGDDEAALLRLWREKRGEIEPEDLSANLIVQLGSVTEHLNRHWYRAEHRSGCHQDGAAAGVSKSRQALDSGNARRNGRGTGAVFEAKFMLPWSFSDEGAAEKAAGPAAAQYVGNRLEDGSVVHCHRGRQVGGDEHSGRSALPAPSAHGGKAVLALRGNWRSSSPVWRRAAPAKDRGGPDRRYERGLQRLGRVCWSGVQADAAGRPRP